MAEEGKDTSSWYKVPTWSGDPSEWRAFKREMSWWIASLDPISSGKYNVAARWALRQSGVVRARCEEYDPADLAGTPAVEGTDPESGEKVVLQAADPFSGLQKLLRSLEDSMGKTALDRKGELRKQFYQSIRRSPGERIATFCTRYRTLTGEMKREGIVLPSEELGWFLKDRLGLDALRVQLLETALAGREEYDQVETEVLRLFRDLHVADPLMKTKPFNNHGDQRQTPLQRFLSQPQQGARQGAPSSSTSSLKSFKTSSSYRFKPSSNASSGRSAYVVEDADEGDEEECDEELVPDDTGSGVPSLEEVLQTEAEVLAAEIQELEESGEVESSILEGLETGVEQAAESLVTMREARSKINEIKKDRGYHRNSSNPKLKLNGNQVEKKKGKTQCWDCGEYGHWGGDAQCPKPGAGLFKPKGAGKKSSGSSGVGKQVKVVETLNTEHVIEENEMGQHEVLMVNVGSLPFSEALASSKQEKTGAPGLARDKVLVGALDSACSRTCAGDTWLKHYLHTLKMAPQPIQDLVITAQEEELFRFGNGGTQRSSVRYRLPMMVGGNLVAVWVSVVKVPSLGLLLGRDFLDGIGAVVSFTKQKLRPDFLDGKLIDLAQVSAGHFALRLVPSSWPRLGSHRWRRWGEDGIIEQQLSASDWFSKKFHQPSKQFDVDVSTHEHLVTEKGIQAAQFAFISVPMSVASPVQAMSSLTAQPSTSLRTPTTSSSTSDARGRFKADSKMAKMASQAMGKGTMARLWIALMACAAAINQIPALPVSSDSLCRTMDPADQGYDGTKAHRCKAWQEGAGPKLVYGKESPRLPDSHQPIGLGSCVPGGSVAGWPAGSQVSQRPSGQNPKSSDRGCESRAGRAEVKSTARRRCAAVDRAERRFADLERRSVAPCNSPESGCGRLHEGGTDQAGARTSGGAAQRSTNGSQEQSSCRLCGSAQRSQAQSLAAWPKKFFSRARAGASSSRSNQCNAIDFKPGIDPAGHRRTVSAPRSKSADYAIPGNAADDGDHAAAPFPRRCSSLRPGKSSELSTDGCGDGRDQCDAPSRASGRTSLERAWLRIGLDDNARDGRSSEARSGKMSHHGFSGLTSSHLDSRPLGLSEARDDGLRTPGDEADSEWRLDADRIKKGQALLISQAWQKHDRARRLISKGDIHAVMEVDWKKEMESYMNETFVTSLELTPKPHDGVFVSEVFTTVQRVIKQASAKGHSVGSALSLETGWDFRRLADRKAGRLVVEKEKPYLLVLAFPCGPWSALMRLNPAHDLDARRAEGIKLIKYAIELAELQLAQGRHFLLENPLTAESWSLPQLKKLLQRLECHQAVFDQCRFQLRGPSGLLHKKPTKIATSSEAIARRLDGRRCLRDHEHEHVLGGGKITSAAGLYTKELANEIILGLEEEFEQSQRRAPHETMAVEEGDIEDDLDREIDPPMEMRDLESSDDEVKIAPPNMKISASVKDAVRKLHNNTGHRSNKRLARALAIAGAPSTAIIAAKTLQCAVCQERRAPKARRPATLPTPKDCGDQVHIDIFEVEDLTETRFYAVHIIDAVSRFQMGEILADKSADSVVQFVKRRWMPIFGPPRVLVADQGREFVSWKFEEMAAQHSTLLWHTAVQSPWQNGICEKGGGILKAIVAAVVKSQSVVGREEMETALQEAITAYNADINEAGVSPAQAALGRQPKMTGDVLGDFGQRLAEHGLVECRPTIARQVAMREVAKLAMLRLHFSRGLRRAELARSRTSTVTQELEPGMIVYYYRMSKYNAKTGPSKKKLSLKRWHGPGLLVALEGHANCFISHKGQLVKTALEHVRRASTMEQITADEWELAVQDVVEAAMRDNIQPLEVEPEVLEPAAPAQQQPEQADLPQVPVQPQELAAAMQSMAASAPPSVSAPPSRRSSLLSTSLRGRGGLVSQPQTPLPPVPASPRPGSGRSSRIESAVGRLMEDSERKRAPEVATEILQDAEREARATGSADLPVPAQPGGTVEHASMSVEQVMSDSRHPLSIIADLAKQDQQDPLEHAVEDHGSWDGRWPTPSRTDWQTHERYGLSWPCSRPEVYAVQTARKEYKWKEMKTEDKPHFKEAAKVGWQAWVDNGAVELLNARDAQAVRARLKARGEQCKILIPRYVYTDKHDGIRTSSRPLPLKANARLVVPGFRDVTAYTVRKDAPTCSRVSFHYLLVFSSSKRWRLVSADVKAAFLKGEEFSPGERDLYIGQIRIGDADEPCLPLGEGQLARLKKGIFGLADSPRRWYLRLHKSLTRLGWQRSIIDSAMWLLWSDSGELEGLVISHVDDLLMGGNARARKLLDELGRELGFGSLESGSFVYCGKRITQDEEDFSITVDMTEYHENLKPVPVPLHRKREPESPLTPGEQKQLRAILGSLQWLVSQVRVDLGFQLSTLQGDRQVVGTLLRANALVRQAKQNSSFALRYLPMDLKSCGLLVVTDASLGNVCKGGSADGSVSDRVYSQATYFIMVADKNLMSGKPGRFNLVDARSHRLGRVCRSTFGAELLSSEEGLDAGQYSRGVFAELMGYPMEHRSAELSAEQIPLQLVTDAKDNFDKCNSDTPTYGSQKSLAFTIAWLRSALRKENTTMSWTSTQNMFADGGTKLMKLEHMSKILQSNEWSVTFSPDFVKQLVKKPTKAAERDCSKALIGSPVGSADPMHGHLLNLGDQFGWHRKDQYLVHVAKDAKAFRTPEPRAESSAFPLRSTYGKFVDSNGSGEWRKLEDKVPYVGLPNRHGAIGDTAANLLTIFMPWILKQERNEAAEESSELHQNPWQHHAACHYVKDVFECVRQA